MNKGCEQADFPAWVQPAPGPARCLESAPLQRGRGPKSPHPERGGVPRAGPAPQPCLTPSARLVGVFLSLVCVSLGCFDEEALRPTLPLPLVAVQPVVRADVQDRVTAVGELIATHHAEIAAEIDGRVTELLLVEGQAVEQGTALLELDPAKRRLTLASARARLRQAAASVENGRRQRDRQRELHDQRIAPRSALDDAQTRLRLQEAQLEAAQAELGVESRALEEATVRAPFAGLVVERRVSLGEYVQVGQPLVELVSLDPIEVEFRLAEIDSGQVRLGQPVEVGVAPYPNQKFSAYVTVIAPTIDPQSRTLRVKAALDNAEGLLRPGLFARADLGLTLHEKVVLVPAAAVLQRVDGSVVFVVSEDDRAERRLVEVARFRENFVQVDSGVEEGERILVRGHADLLDGQRVRIFRAPEGSTEAEGSIKAEGSTEAEGA